MVKPPLSLVGPRGIDDPPPRELGPNGLRLWRSVLSEFVVDDCAGREILCQAAQALDRAEALAEQISRDGELIHTRAGPRSHPSLKDEVQLRSFVTRTLLRLNLNAEPQRAIGRPPPR
jgi:hypothetical protein